MDTSQVAESGATSEEKRKEGGYAYIVFFSSGFRPGSRDRGGGGCEIRESVGLPGAVSRGCLSRTPVFASSSLRLRMRRMRVG